MSALKSKLYRLETQVVEFHQGLNDRVESDVQEQAERFDRPIERLTTLEKTVGQLSINSRNHAFLDSHRLEKLITGFRDDLRLDSTKTDVFTGHLSALSWLIAAKASIHTLALVLKVFSNNVLILNEEIRYWEDTLESDWRLGLYTVQTSPLRVWRRVMDSAYHDNKKSTYRRTTEYREARNSPNSSIWPRFYASVQRCICTSLCSVRTGVFSPLARSKLEIHRKKSKLKALRDFNATAVGRLIEECLSFKIDNHPAGYDNESANHSLQQIVQDSVGLMSSLLRGVGNDHEILQCQDGLETHRHDGSRVHAQPQCVAEQLVSILTDLLPEYCQISAEKIAEFGRPSPAIRYWLPLSLALVSTSTSLTILRNVGPVLINWISNIGSTTLEFWRNWVVDPTRKLIRTIRHDEKSEIALISRNSLEADRASLERMVVDFVLDRGQQGYPALSADTIADKVREGDLTPVLRAYEKDLRSPFIGTFRGDLVRALLIQIQKTKVDVEIATSGIDALLKSQELVFGFIGLTPGLLISYASIRWFSGLLGNRRGFRMGRRQDDFRYALRNIHRILTSSVPTVNGRLTYRNHGLMICNAEILLNKAQTMLKGEDLRAFQEDIGDLVNENRVEQQLHIVERMTWTYSKWT